MVNPIVTGWVNYFRHTNASQAFRGLQRFVNIRFRRYLTQRSKGRDFGWKRFPNSKLYAMGLAYIGSGMLDVPGETCAWCAMKTVGPPYSGKLNVRWDGKGMVTRLGAG